MGNRVAPETPTRPLAVIEVPAGEILYRCHLNAYAPIHFGRESKNRFDAPHGEFGVCYLSRSPAGAFAETFLRKARGQFVERTDLDNHALSRIKVESALQLVQCFGAGLRKNGMDARVSSSKDYPRHQAFSRRCHDHPAAPDGLIYRARFDDDQFSIALFERSSASIAASFKPTPWLETGTVIEDILDRYEIAI